MYWILALAAWATAVSAEAQTGPQTLKDAYRGRFHIGAALPTSVFDGRDPRAAALVERQFDSISPENALKWSQIHPRPDAYDFAEADRYVDFGERRHMFVIGHNLVWHNQVPKWVFEDAQGRRLGRDALLARLRDHILTVVGRYRGRIAGWDVVNEALNDDGSLRRSPWLEIIGPDYIEKAFQYAHEADPAAELYYNDYSLEGSAKRRGALDLIARLKARGVPITGVGLQDHDSLQWPSVAEEDETIQAFGRLGMRISISELDVEVLPRDDTRLTADVSAKARLRPGLNPYPDRLPAQAQQALAQRYADLFAVFLKHSDVIERVTFWGVTDAGSWLNDWPVPGRTDYPLLFDRAGAPKPAFFAVLKAPESVRP